MEAKGKRGEDKWLPHLLGHEGVGVVEKVGPQVTKVKIGEKVIVGWIIGQGFSSVSPQFSTANGVPINSGAATTFSEYSVVSENRVYIAPEGFPDEFLPLFGCALLTGGGMALNHFDEKIHKSILLLKAILTLNPNSVIDITEITYVLEYCIKTVLPHSKRRNKRAKYFY